MVRWRICTVSSIVRGIEVTIRSFFHLLKHEMRTNGLLQTMGWWKSVILVVLLFVAFVYVSIMTVLHRFTIVDISNYSLGFGLLFPLMMVGMYFHQMRNEWLSSTYMWWLTLPYSRFTLVMTKLFAGFLQVVKITLFFHAVILILAIYASIQSGTFMYLTQHVRIIAITSIVILSYYPAIASFMMLLATLGKSVYRFLVPLMWVLFFPLMVAGLQGFIAPIFSAGMRISNQLVNDQAWYTHLLIPYFWYVVLVSWALAAMMIVVNAWLLKKKLVV